MGMPNPIPGEDPGPDYAENLESSFNILDGHNHAPGKGVLINPNGININADLAINSNNLTLVKTVNFTNLVAPLSGLAPNLGAAYVAGGELYYNDESGNVVQITNMGSVNAGAGSITGLPSGTASASYSAGSQTFIWQSATSTAANMDNGSVTIREVAPSANGITLSSPTALAADYTINLLTALPAVTSLLVIDNTGNLAAITDINPFIAPIDTANIADHSVTQVKLEPRSTGITVGAGGVAVSVLLNIIVSSPTPNPVGLNISLVTTGRPVFLGLQGSPGTSQNSNINAINGSSILQFTRNGTVIYDNAFGNGSGNFVIPPAAFSVLDMGVNGSPGTYTYDITIFTSSGTSINIQNVNLIAYEI